MNALPEHIAQGRRQILQSKTELSVLGPGPYVTSSGPLERAFQELQVQPGSSCPPGQVGARKEADPGKAPSAMPGPQDPVLHGDAFHSFVHLPIHQSVRPSIRPCRRPLSNTPTCYASCQVLGVTVSAWEQIPCFKREKSPFLPFLGEMPEWNPAVSELMFQSCSGLGCGLWIPAYALCAFSCL